LLRSGAHQHEDALFGFMIIAFLVAALAWEGSTRSLRERNNIRDKEPQLERYYAAPIVSTANPRIRSRTNRSEQYMMRLGEHGANEDPETAEYT
jgi:hypothetical protein